MQQENRSTEPQVRNKITLITFLCSLLVIWIHTYNLETYGISHDSTGFEWIVYYIEKTWSNLTNIAVPFFFFVSGFLFFRTFELKKIKEKYLSRVKGVLIPYIIWCTIYFLYYVLVTNLPYIQNFVSSDPIPFSVIGWLKALWPESYYTLWFLKDLIIMIAICPLIYVLFKNKWVGGVIMLLLVINSLFGFVSIPLSGLVYYAGGAYIALSFKGIEYRRNMIISFAGCAYLVVLFLFGFKFINNVLVNLAFFIAVWFLTDLIVRDNEYPWWMKITFFTYVAHDLFLEMFEKLFLLILGKRPIFALLDYILVPIIVFIVIALIAAFFKKFLPRTWKVLTGMRS